MLVSFPTSAATLSSPLTNEKHAPSRMNAPGLSASSIWRSIGSRPRRGFGFIRRSRVQIMASSGPTSGQPSFSQFTPFRAPPRRAGRSAAAAAMADFDALLATLEAARRLVAALAEHKPYLRGVPAGTAFPLVPGDARARADDWETEAGWSPKFGHACSAACCGGHPGEIPGGTKTIPVPPGL
ncbi:hypothetical protein SBA6_530012 [Candidatus Sulfopaludibacter sp. SbA6]|nr:hypothetical protein SBA6_530012 [Candidatus Sulfopaludibacter sp. SbA6]